MAKHSAVYIEAFLLKLLQICKSRSLLMHAVPVNKQFLHLLPSVYEAFRLNSPSAARERQIMLFSNRVYDINMHFKKLCDKRFRRIFSSAFQWCRWFF